MLHTQDTCLRDRLPILPTAPSPSFHNFSVVQELVMLRWHSEFKMIYQELRKLVITHEIIIKDE